MLFERSEEHVFFLFEGHAGYGTHGKAQKAVAVGHSAKNDFAMEVLRDFLYQRDIFAECPLEGIFAGRSER
jgi:hypothetical protein